MQLERIQIISLISSVLFLIFIFELIRRKKIKEAYAILWLIFGFIFIFFSIWKQGLDYISELVGIYYPPAFLFLLLIIAIILILIQFSIVISKQSDILKKLTQEIALIKTTKDNCKNDRHTHRE
ncbi:MAG: DUF2304 domain-containing protein [Candidatus Rifleibacteriota bacterium]